MASGGKRGAGERVLESKHVIGLFLLMLLFSGVFFTLGYVMGRNQYDMQVRAATNAASKPELGYVPRSDSGKKTAEDTASPDNVDPSTSTSSSPWINTASDSPANTDPHLEPAPARALAPAAKPATAKGKPQPQPQPVSVRPADKNPKSALSAPAIPSGTYVIQVAALTKQDDALVIASSLQKKHYAVYVQKPQKDKYYRVQVGPFKDQKSADAAKKGLEGEGFKAFYVKH
jgi:DedD protein